MPRRKPAKNSDVLRLQNHFAEVIQRIAHDVQAPVKKILSFVDLLNMKMSPETKEPVKEYLLRIERNAVTLARVIHQLKEYAQYAAPGTETERVDLKAAFNNAQEALKTKLDEVRPALSVGRLPTVSGSKPQLTRLCENLLHNALTHRKEDPLQIKVDAKRNKEGWTIVVRDNGRGIAPEDVERVFQIFPAMSGQEGPATGIGLALCKKIVENHGGKIWCESVPRHGSTFFFTLPD